MKNAAARGTRVGQTQAKTGDISAPADEDLQAVAAAWPALPAAIRAGILAMVKAAGGGA